MAHRILNISDTVYCLLSTYTVYPLLSTVYSLLSTVYYVNWSVYYFTTLLQLQTLQTCLFSSVQWIYQWVSYLPTGWPHDHGPTNAGAMVKIWEDRAFGLTLIICHSVLASADVSAPCPRGRRNRLFIPRSKSPSIVIAVVLYRTSKLRQSLFSLNRPTGPIQS